MGERQLGATVVDPLPEQVGILVDPAVIHGQDPLLHPRRLFVACGLHQQAEAPTRTGRRPLGGQSRLLGEQAVRSGQCRGVVGRDPAKQREPESMAV